MIVRWLPTRPPSLGAVLWRLFAAFFAIGLAARLAAAAFT